MRKHIKKFAAMALSVVMIAMMAIPAFAVDITINGSGAEYSAYQLLTLTTALTCQEEHEHEDSCYTFSYAVNSKYESILANAAFDTDEITSKTEAGTLDDGIISHIKGLTGDGIQTFGDTVYRAIKDAQTADPDFTAEKVTTDKTLSGVEQGYYLIAETSADDNGVFSLIMLDTAGQVDVEVDAKEALPTVAKAVMETTDTGNSEYGATADYDVGDDVQFKLTGTLPANLAAFMDGEGETASKAYQYIFHDTLGGTLTLNEDSVKVYIGTTEVKSGFEVKMKKNDTSLDCSFEVRFSDLFAAKDENGDAISVDVSSVVTVEYTAKLTAGQLKNNNAVALEFSNDPYSDGTSTTIPEEVQVFTYSLTVTKEDENGDALDGASFTLKKYNGTAYEEYANGAEAAVAAARGELTCTTEHEHTDDCYETVYTVTFTGLDAGQYELSETVVPDGYTGIKPIEFTVVSAIENGALTSLSASDTDNKLTFTGDTATGVISVTIQNAQGSELPTTGGTGIVLMSVAAICLIAAGAVIIVVAKVKYPHA